MPNISSLLRKKLKSNIVCKGVPAPPFLRHSPLDPGCPLYKIFVSPLLFSVSPPYKVFQRVPPTITQPPPVLIQHTKLPYT